MSNRKFLLFAVVLFVFLACTPAWAENLAAEAAVPTELADYIKNKDDSFSWKLREIKKNDSGTHYRIDLVSQTWQGIEWTHVLDIYEPKNVERKNHLMLYIGGGRNGRDPNPGESVLGFMLAEQSGARVALLSRIPNQPLLGDRVEDDLISQTFLEYLKTGDASWPLLFPMTKSAIRAMDAIEEFAAEKEWDKIEGFFVFGASKRGWTTWLCGAADTRVFAIAPFVINLLNMIPQMERQHENFGEFSEQIHDYTGKKLLDFDRIDEMSPREKKLWVIVDPYFYRGNIKIPKLLVHGANDRYWNLDGTDLYWNDLLGPKYILTIPNVGHGLGEGAILGAMTAVAFFQQIVDKKPLPEIKCEVDETETGVLLKVTSSVEPKDVMIWTATATGKDFRDSKWTPKTLEREGEWKIWIYKAEVAKPKDGHIAYYVSFKYEYDSTAYALCTLIKIL